MKKTCKLCEADISNLPNEDLQCGPFKDAPWYAHAEERCCIQVLRQRLSDQAKLFEIEKNRIVGKQVARKQKMRDKQSDLFKEIQLLRTKTWRGNVAERAAKSAHESAKIARNALREMLRVLYDKGYVERHEYCSIKSSCPTCVAVDAAERALGIEDSDEARSAWRKT